MNTFHALGDIGLKEVVTRNTASALSALFVTIQILLSASPTAAISVDLAKKCRDMAIKAHPRAMPGKPYAQAERDFFRQCVAKNGQIESTDAASILYEPKTIVRRMCGRQRCSKWKPSTWTVRHQSSSASIRRKAR
jgi:hypothetical protein